MLVRFDELVGDRYRATHICVVIPYFRVNARTLRPRIASHSDARTLHQHSLGDGRIYDGVAGSKRFGVFSENTDCLSVSVYEDTIDRE